MASKKAKGQYKAIKIEKAAYTDDDKEGKEVGWMERKELNFALLIIFVIGVLVIIFFGFKLMQQPKVISIEDMHAKNMHGKLDPKQGYMYNSFSFVYAGGSWFTKVYEPRKNLVSNVQIHFGAREAENITVDGDPNILNQYNGTYITFDPTDDDLAHIALASSELSINLASVLGKIPVAACAKNETMACETRPIVNCQNNNKNPIIYIKNAPQTMIVQQGNCIVVAGDGFELVRAVDKLLLMWMGIIRTSNPPYKNLNTNPLS